MNDNIANLVDGALQALDASVSSASMGRSQGADGGNLGGTGCLRSSGTSSSDATQTAPSHTHATSATGNGQHCEPLNEY